MDVDVPSILSFASNMLQRVLPRAFSSTGLQGSNVGSQLRKVHQAGLATPGRPPIPASPPTFAIARNEMYSLARQQLARGNRDFAVDTINNANAALRSGDKARAGTFLAMGLATFRSPSAFAMAASVSDERATVSTSLPEALHAGWQANFGRGVTALIERVHDQLYLLHRDVSTDVVHGDSSRDALLEAIRKDGSMTLTYRHAITKASGLINTGQHEDALATLRAVPIHQAMMTYFAMPTGTPGSEVAYRALAVAHNDLDKFQTLVNGDDDIPTGSLGLQVSYARENPDALRMRGLVQSVGAELFSRSVYDKVMDTVRPPVPPRAAS